MSARSVQVQAGFACIFALIACGDQASPTDQLEKLKVVNSDRSDLPLPGLSREWNQRFVSGDGLFERPFSDALGLGPVYIRQSCNSCHAGDARGPGAVRKMVLVGDDGRTPALDQSALAYGHTVRPQLAAGAGLGITVPEDRADVLVTKREPPAVYGRGYIEAVLDSEIERVEAEQAEHGRVSGRINWVEYYSEPNPDTRYHASPRGVPLIGRFGLKARIASLDEFAADAFQGDMGITSDLRPTELPNPSAEDDELPGIDVDADTVNRVADYMRLLRIPRRAEAAQDKRGQKLFEATGCADCHVPALRTRDDYPIEALAGIDAPVYSDLLLHDMGPDFSDGLRDFDAEGSEWRTAPLLGLRYLPRYLHDGRAETLDEAIELHGAEGSEARSSVERFRALPASQRETLLQFVSAL
ncbi:MAG TPA: di-heme oxidoredictase family protein [Polyangiales bacterium]|nr:di-heme oxidoredictase family protein [Polyangiales bacterium]